MNKQQENKLTMYEGLLTLLQSNNSKILTIAGFGTAVTEFSSMVAGIKSKSLEVNNATVGKTASKYYAEDLLVSALLPICSALYIYGRKQGNAEVKERAYTSERKLRSMRDTELASYGNSIAELAQLHAVGLAGLDITAAKITDLKTKADAYSASIGSRESSVVDRKGARESMNDLFNKADELLDEEIDHFMEMLRPTETELYNKYFSARVVKDTGVRHEKPEAAAVDGKK